MKKRAGPSNIQAKPGSVASVAPEANPYLEDRVRIGTTLAELMVHLWPYFMKQKLLFFVSIAAVVIVATAGRLTVTVFGYAVDHGIIGHNVTIVLWAAFIYGVLAIARCYFTFLQNYLFARVGNRVLTDIREQLVDHVQQLPLAYFDQTPAGRIVTRITNDVVSLGELFTEGLISIFAAVISMVAIVIAIIAISLKMTFFTLLIAPPLIWVVALLSAKILVVLRISKAKIAAINAFMAESINGMRVLQLFGRSSDYNNRFATLSTDYRNQQMKSVVLYAMLWPAVSFFNAGSVAIALYIGGRLIIDPQAAGLGAGSALTEGAMIAFILHVRAFMDPLSVILEKYQNLQNSLSGAERIFTLLEETPEPSSGSTLKNARLKGELKFEQTCFRYGPHLPLALDHFDLLIHSGESVALVGRTGSGKSTTIALLQRFYNPTEGAIFLDGIDLTTIARSDVRRKIGVVQQDTFMFSGTVAENISLRDPNVSRSQIERAADRAHLVEMLERRAGGLDARVEERGANLSFGERQLIAFARILAFDPDILILDEATASIDSHSESLIQDATKRVREGRTSIIIAHRISTILDCDKIVVLEKGKIQEVGTHAELYSQDGVYRALCNAQFRENQTELS